MPAADRTFQIAHISDIHCGGPHFMPSLMERAIGEINDLGPDLVICTGDLTTFGFKQEFAQAKRYLDRIECDYLVVVPGNHDSRNVGYVHFEQLFGDRNSVLHVDGVTVVAVDSTEPDLDHGQIGRGQLPLDRGAVRTAGRPADLRPPPPPAPGAGHRARAERRPRRGRRDRVPAARRRRPRPVGPQARAVRLAARGPLRRQHRARSRRCVSGGNTRPCYNVVEVTGAHVDVWRKYPFHGQEKIIQFSTETLAFEKYTARIESEVTTHS